MTEAKKIDKLANLLIKEVDEDNKHFKEIRGLCLKYGLKSYKNKKFVKNFKDVIRHNRNKSNA